MNDRKIRSGTNVARLPTGSTGVPYRKRTWWERWEDKTGVVVPECLRPEKKC